MAEKVLVKQDSATVPCIVKPDSQETPKSKVTVWLVLAIITTILGSGFPSGYCLAVINTPQEIILSWLRVTFEEQTGKELTTTEEMSLWALIVSIYIVGAIIGAPSGGLLADKGGRRIAIFVNHALCLLSAFLCVWCQKERSVYMLIFGRFISGLCSGLSTSIMPTYLSEIAPSAHRGVMGVLYPMAMCMGVLTSQVLGMDHILGTSEYWPYLLGGFGVPVALALLLHPTLPDSPSYCFVILGDEAKGRKALHHLRGGPSKDVEAEESSLRSLMQKNQSDGGGWGLFTMIRSQKFRLPLLITMIFNIGQQFSGINAVFYYSTMIFRSAGLNMQESQGASIGAATVNWVVSTLAIPLIRYARRRTLLLSSVALCICCQAVLMISLALIRTTSYASYFAIAGMMSYVLVYHLGLGPIPYMIATELFPSGPRSVGISLGGTSNWLSNLLVGFTYPLVQEEIGEYSFLLFMLSSCLLWIFSYKFLPETLGNGETPEQLSPSEEGHSDVCAPCVEDGETSSTPNVV